MTRATFVLFVYNLFTHRVMCPHLFSFFFYFPLVCILLFSFIIGVNWLHLILSKLL